MVEQHPKTTRRAPIVVTEHTARKMKSYLIYESELDHLSVMDALTALFASIGSFFASIALGRFTEMFIQGPVSEETAARIVFMEWTCGGFSVLCIVLAGLVWGIRGNNLKKIKREVVED